jgi:hypothetical protein
MKTMSRALPIARLRQADAALDGALLKQTGLLAGVIIAGRETGSGRALQQAELMRLVKSHQTLLTSSDERIFDRLAA